MIDRMAILLTMTLWALANPGQPAQRSDPARQQDESVRGGATIQETPARPAVNVDEAIRLAIDALDRLGARSKTGEMQILVDQANDYIEAIQASDPTNPRLPYLLGRAYAFMGRRGDAVDQLLKFVNTRHSRNEWKAYRILGDLFVDEFPRLAQANYKKAAALNPTEPSVLFGLSICAFKLGDTEEAIRLAREVLTSDGGRTVRYISHLAALLNSAGRSKEAVREAKVALDLANASMRDYPGSHERLLAVDAQYRQIIDILQARLSEPSQGAVEDYLSLATYIRERARITQMLSLHDVLRVLMAGVDKTSPDTPPALLEQYGIVLAEVGRIDDAVEVFERLRSIDPDNAAATRWLDLLRP